MSKKSPNTLKTLNSLKAAALRDDPKLKRGDTWKSEEFRVLLIQKEDSPSDYIETGKVICINCKTLLAKSDGSHFNRHIINCKKRVKKRTLDPVENSDNVSFDASKPQEKIRRIDDYNWKRLKQNEIAAATIAISKYCVKSGRSFNHCSSNEMKTLVVDLFNSISCGYGDEVKSQLPSRQTIQKRSEDISRVLIKKAHDFLKPFLEKGRVNLLTDHGKHIVNYLSLYGSVVDENFKLHIVPLAFIPALEKKTGAETARLILNRLESYGWTTEEIRACNVTADGALGSLSAHFSSYVRCVSHSINLLGSNGTDPAMFQKRSLSSDDIDRLKKATEVLDSAETLSNGIRSNSEICESLPRLPSLPGETRWLSSLKCLSDIYDLQEPLEKIYQKLNIAGARAFTSIVDIDRKIGKSVVLVFSDLLQYSLVFQSQSQITTHLVLPAYKRLHEKWTKYRDHEFTDVDVDEIDEDIVVSLAKSGLAAYEKYYKELSEKSALNFAATMLSPQHKQISNFEKTEIEKAKKYLMEMLPKNKVIIRDAPTKKPNSVLSLSKLLAYKTEEEESQNDELKRYLLEPVDEFSEESLEEYWIRKKIDFPNLFEVAAKVFSVVPSESICETCFSLAGFLLDKRRTRLQYSKAELIVVGSQIAKKYPEWI